MHKVSQEKKASVSLKGKPTGCGPTGVSLYSNSKDGLAKSQLKRCSAEVSRKLKTQAILKVVVW